MSRTRSPRLEVSIPLSKPFGDVVKDVRDAFHDLDIYLTHAHAGTSYFSGNRYPDGHRMGFTPCTNIKDERTGFTVKQSVLMSSDKWESGFFIQLDNAARKNPHYLARVLKQLEARKTAFRDAFEAKDSQRLHSLAGECHDAAMIGYKDTKERPEPAQITPAPTPTGNDGVNMKLLTKEVLDLFAKTGSQANSEDPTVICKFFSPVGAATWYATEYDPTTRLFFGYVSLFGDHNDEWGPFSLSELQAVKGPLGLGIERDRHFTPKPISQVGIKSLRV